MAIKLNGSTSGSVALDAPADTSPSGTNVTLTLPTSAGSSGQYLQTNGSGTLSWASVVAGSGRILQEVSATSTTQSNTTSTTFVNSGFGATITPSSASSKIIILCNSSITSSAAGNGAFQKIVRDSTDVTNTVVVYNDGTAADTWRSTFMFGIDSPNTTSSTTYRLHFRSLYSSSTVYNNWGSTAPQQIYLLELGQ